MVNLPDRLNRTFEREVVVPGQLGIDELTNVAGEMGVEVHVAKLLADVAVVVGSETQESKRQGRARWMANTMSMLSIQFSALAFRMAQGDVRATRAIALNMAGRLLAVARNDG